MFKKCLGDTVSKTLIFIFHIFLSISQLFLKLKLKAQYYCYFKLEWVPPPINYFTLVTTGPHNTSHIFFFYSLYFHFDLGFQKPLTRFSFPLSFSLSTLHGFKPSPKWRSKRKRQIRSSSQASSPRFLSFTGIRISPP
jgi:hypothetical protein